jgi:hypothetical protein
MATLTTIPELPAPKQKIAVVFTLTQSGSNYIKVWVTNAPPGSSWRKKLDDAVESRIEVHKGDGGESGAWRESFEVGGKYTFVAQEYTKGAAPYRGSYQGAPDTAPTETKVGSEATLYMYIGQRMSSEIRAGIDSVNLVCWVWDNTIQNTTRAVQGEDSPRLFKEKSTDRERAAIESTAVRDALEDLVGLDCDDAMGDVTTTLANIALKFRLHQAEVGVHYADDTDNAVPAGLLTSMAAYTVKDAVNELLKRVYYHYTNDATLGGVTTGRDSASYHSTSDPFFRDDNFNLPLYRSVDEKNAFWAIADLWRSYEAHRVSEVPDGSHLLQDVLNQLTDLPPLLEVANQIFTIWSAIDPVVPPTQSTGAMTLIAGAGFSEKPL